MRRYMYCAPFVFLFLPVPCADLSVFLLPSSIPNDSVSGSVPIYLVCGDFLPFGPFLCRDLSNNQISELASDAFQGLRSLNSL